MLEDAIVNLQFRIEDELFGAKVHLTPTIKKVNLPLMKTAVEIYKFLPKTNCGKCGTGTCFGFAAKLATHQAKPDDCPFPGEDARAALREASQDRIESPGTVYEQALILLQPKVQALDFELTAKLFDARLLDNTTLEIVFLNETFRVTKERYSLLRGKSRGPGSRS